MTREVQIRQTAAEWLRYNHPTCTQDMLVEAFRCGAEWADKHQPNPWISVEDRLPENGDMVFTRSVLIIKGGGECSENEQFLAQTFVGYWLTDCCKQHRMHGFIYDTLDKVTHWMPIPQLLHDDMLINGLNEMNEHFKKGE